MLQLLGEHGRTGALVVTFLFQPSAAVQNIQRLSTEPRLEERRSHVKTSMRCLPGNPFSISRLPNQPVDSSNFCLVTCQIKTIDCVTEVIPSEPRHPRGSDFSFTYVQAIISGPAHVVGPEKIFCSTDGPRLPRKGPLRHLLVMAEMSTCSFLRTV